MSVLIKGLKMPKDCIKCPLCLFTDGHWKCLADGSHADFGGTCIPQNCPLVELPDHGDLIDRSMLIGGFADWYIQESPMYLGDSKVVAETIGDAMKAIEAAPVVIPAERSE